MASKYYDWDDNRIHYRKSGMGDPILLVHGLYPGASSEEFDHNIRALSRDFCVYAVDLLGFGLSDAPRIRYRANLYPLLLSDFIRDVIGAPAGIIAAGESAPFVAALAADEPEIVSRVVFISPPDTPVTSARGSWVQRAVRELLRNFLLFPPFHLLFQEVMAGEWEIREMLRRSFREKTLIGSGVVERLSELARMPGVLETYASMEVGLLSLPLEPVLPRVLAPTLFVVGRCASAEMTEGVDRLSRLPRNARLEWIDRAADWAHYEMPNSTNRVIAGFLRSETESDVASRPATESASLRAVA